MDPVQIEFISFLKNSLSDEEINVQTGLLDAKNLYTEILDIMPDYLVVLNQYGQIIYANKAFKISLMSKYGDTFLGKRPGEVFNCIYAQLDGSRCGLSNYCTVCGAFKVIISSLKGKEDVQECRIIQRDSNDALDLRVWAKPVVINNQNFVVFAFTDISNEKRRLALERIFFHDVLNTASSLSSYINLLKTATDEEQKELEHVGTTLTNRLLEEIKSQRDLAFAENNELEVKKQLCNSFKIISELKIDYINQKIAEGKKIEIASGFNSIDFVCDEILISRVLSNMLKNALEAAVKGDVITLDCKVKNDKIIFSVHNPGFIPKEIQYQIFQRSFSTKGAGRGLGTYSMKLISNRYLKGDVYFLSNEKNGTTFFAEYSLNPVATQTAV